MTLPPELTAWFDQHARPIWEAHYTLDLDRARECYNSALASAESEPDADLRLSKLLRLGSAWLFVQSELGSHEEQRSAFDSLLASCRTEPPGSVSEQLIPVTEALARLQADALGMEELQPMPLLRLMTNIREESRGPNFWNLAAEWAFKHSDGQLLEEAYVFFTTQRPAVMADQMFARLRLMRGLRDGNVTENDILQTLARMEVLSQMWDFERLLLPECDAQGLISADVQVEIELKKQALEATGKHAPIKR